MECHGNIVFCFGEELLLGLFDVVFYEHFCNDIESRQRHLLSTSNQTMWYHGTSRILRSTIFIAERGNLWNAKNQLLLLQAYGFFLSLELCEIAVLSGLHSTLVKLFLSRYNHKLRCVALCYTPRHLFVAGSYLHRQLEQFGQVLGIYRWCAVASDGFAWTVLVGDPKRAVDWRFSFSGDWRGHRCESHQPYCHIPRCPGRSSAGRFYWSSSFIFPECQYPMT